jgi:rhodanese-related sulfurtransferase
MTQKKPNIFVWSLAGALALVVVVVGVWMVLNQSAAGAFPYGDLSPQQVSELIEDRAPDGLVILDVRTAEEYADGHLPAGDLGELNLDFYQNDFAQRLAQLDKSNAYLLVCRTGNRSGAAMAMMTDLGFDKLYELEGGMVAWQAARLPVERGL